MIGIKYLLLGLVLLAAVTCACSPAKRPADEPDAADTDTDSDSDTDADTDTDTDVDSDTDTDTDTDTDADTDTDTEIDIADVIAAGAHHTCAVLTSGVMKCWGYNDYGQIGDGTTVESSTPVDVLGLSSGVQAIAAGGAYTCAVLTSGGMKCWGYNSDGQLGDGTTVDKTTPVNVFGFFSGQTISAGSAHTCALLDSGGMRCWGDNGWGQLGDGTSVDRVTPVDVSGLTSGVQAIAAGWLHTCAVLDSGGMKCWGNNWAGALGDGTLEDNATPVDVFGLSSGVQAIAAGLWHTCALLTSGGVKCWGDNGSGQLGDGTTTTALAPVDVSGLSSGVQAIAAGGDHTCALLDSGGAKCWGYNGHGDLGDGTWADKDTPVDVSGLFSGVQAIAAGNWHTCAVLDSGGMKCWGYNDCGQLGDGTGVDSSTPVDVSGF